jgi:ribosomal protein L32E
MVTKKTHPYFNVPNYRGKHGKMRVKNRWRKQKGVDNKKKKRKASHGASPRVGYGNAPSIRGLHPSGMYEMTVHRPEDLALAAGKLAVISSTVGRQKRLLIQAKAKELGIRTKGRVAS